MKPFPSPGDLPNPGIERVSPAVAVYQSVYHQGSPPVLFLIQGGFHPQMQPVGASQVVVSNVPRFSGRKLQNWSFDSKPTLIGTSLAVTHYNQGKKTVSHRCEGNRSSRWRPPGTPHPRAHGGVTGKEETIGRIKLREIFGRGVWSLAHPL